MIKEFGGDLIQWLRGFYFVARTGSVTRAADAMRRNQPAVSHQIKCLEEEFGIFLFERSRGKMELTAEGKVLLDLVVPLFESIEEMKEKLYKPKLPVEGTVRVATTHAVILYYLPRFVLDFHKIYPQIPFDLQGGGVETVLAAVETGSADFGIASFLETPAGLVTYDLFETQLKLITSRKHKILSPKNISMEAIAALPHIGFPRTSTITPLIEKRFAQEGLKVNWVLVFNNFEIVKKYVELGMGVAILDDFTITSDDGGKLAVYDLSGFFGKRKYQIVMRQKKYLNPAARDFFERIRKGCSLP
ncbi:MAG TPA: LysR family transcriptional regulator [Thermodesulfobacteriota bacterium]|nr:LysR family transcriptional regulator [Thermodesulfobacteriota bacterium]